jgi:hypothetical protein
VVTGVIKEEDSESQMNHSQQEEIQNDVLDFLRQTKHKMQQDHVMGRSNVRFDIQIPKKSDSAIKRTVKPSDQFTFDAPGFNPQSKLKMKGIIGGVNNKKKI